MLESSNAISASAIWSRLSRASAHASASWAASSWPIVSSFIYPPSSISGQQCTQNWRHIGPSGGWKSDNIRARGFEYVREWNTCVNARNNKKPRKAGESLSGAARDARLRHRLSLPTSKCGRNKHVTRRVRNQPWRGGRWPSPNRWCLQRHPACRGCGRASWRGR